MPMPDPYSLFCMLWLAEWEGQADGSLVGRIAPALCWQSFNGLGVLKGAPWVLSMWTTLRL